MLGHLWHRVAVGGLIGVSGAAIVEVDALETSGRVQNRQVGRARRAETHDQQQGLALANRFHSLTRSHRPEFLASSTIVLCSVKDYAAVSPATWVSMRGCGADFRRWI